MSSAPAPAPDDDRLPSEVWVLVAAAFCVAIGFGIVAPVLPAYARSFDVSMQAAAAIVSVFALMRLVFAPAGGALTERLGERSVYLAGLLIVALSTGAAAFADDYVHLLVARGLGGIGSTMFTVSAVALLVRIAPPRMRGRVNSLYGAGFLLGNILGPALGSLTAGLGYRAPFLIYAGTLLVAAAIVAVKLSGVGGRRAAGEPARERMPLAEALALPSYRALLVSGFANGWSNFGTRVALLPLFAAAVPGLGVQWAGIALTVFALGNGLVLTRVGGVVDRRGRKPFLLAGLVVNGAATVVLGWATSVPLLLAVSFVAGLGAGAINPAQQAAVADIVGGRRSGGNVVAAFQMAQDAGAIVGPVLAGAIADRWGFGPAFAVAALLTVAAVLAWAPAPETYDELARRR